MRDKQTYTMGSIHIMLKYHQGFFFFFLLLMGCSPDNRGVSQSSLHKEAGKLVLEVSAIGKEYNPIDAEIAVYQKKFSKGGNTSVRNVDKEHLKWKDQGYFQRNRDLGQVFTPEKDFYLKAVVLRTGPGHAAVLHETPGAKVFMQFYEVRGKPRINDNETPFGTESKHGFTKSHRADDYIEGVSYKSIAVVKGGIFPDIAATHKDGVALDDDEGKLYYMRWALKGLPTLKFEAGKSYAFVVGFEEPGRGLGFTLANYNAASATDFPTLEDGLVAYQGGWGIRREGDGTLPPTMYEDENPPVHNDKLELVYKESLFETEDARYSLEPTTDGYPDVDTYRDLEFALEVNWENPYE